MTECNHYWIPNSGLGGEPDFRPNRQMEGALRERNGEISEDDIERVRKGMLH